MLALGAVALAFGAVVLGGTSAARDALAVWAAAVALAGGSSAAGLALLWRLRLDPRSGFAVALVGLFLGRVGLVGLFGLALLALAPGHLVLGLISFAGFHLLFTVLEIALLVRAPTRGGGGAERRARHP